MQISPHFKRGEFACHCGCGFDTVDAELIEVLEGARQHFGVPVQIVSGARCQKHNATVGGEDQSQHLLGRAADIKVKGVEPSEVAAHLTKLYPGRFGIGLYPTWVHIDTRSGRAARWGGA